MTGTRQAELMPDYGAAWPLWGGGGMCDAEELGLSPALAARLRAWQDLFDEHFSYDGG